MLKQIIVGGLASIGNIAIHALVMTAVIGAARAAGARYKGQSLLLVAVMAAAVSVLMAAHGLEIVMWALAYWLVRAAPAGADLIYFAAVNFTTLGYGDVIPVKEWQLLGPITAMNGVLLFGWSVAVMFEVLHRALAQAAPPGSAL